MSIKSQKSLNDECSEIIEKSYSVKSLSEESLSCDDEEECLARVLMNKITPAVLSQLRRCFRKNKQRSRAQDIDRRVEEVMRQAAAEEGIEFAVSAPPPEDTMWLDENGFVAALNKIFGDHKYSSHARALFQMMDSFRTGRVWWRQLVARLVAAGARRTRTRADAWAPLAEPAVCKLSHCKRETIVKIVSVETAESFCYVAVSKGGRVGVYSGQLQLLHSYGMFYQGTDLRRRVKNRWVTDAVYLSDVQCMAAAASDRSLAVYDASTVAHALLYSITGLPSIPTCLAYNPSLCAGGGSELSLGSECGDVTRLRFLRARTQLLYAKHTDKPNHYFWMELSCPPHSTYCSISRYRRCHARRVRRVQYTAGGALASAAHDAAASVRVRQLGGALPDYVYRLHAGVSCFHCVWSLRLLATGSADGAVRLWAANHRPYATLRTPTPTPVLDVAVVPNMEIVVAYCNNCTVHIWDLYEECLLQSLKIKFPFLGVLGKKVEFGTCCIYPGPARREPVEEVGEATELSPRPISSACAETGARRGQGEPEYRMFNRCELLVSCCDHVCVLRLAPPPGAQLRARRPSAWNLPDYPLGDTEPSRVRPVLLTPLAPATPLLSPSTVYPAAAELHTADLDTLLENAGLQGILEKDFVLMQGLKNDLNRKLAEMEANKETVLVGASAHAPHRALRTLSAAAPRPADDFRDEYRRVMRLFPGSGAGTPGGSHKSTPRATPRHNATPRHSTTPRYNVTPRLHATPRHSNRSLRL